MFTHRHIRLLNAQLDPARLSPAREVRRILPPFGLSQAPYVFTRVMQCAREWSKMQQHVRTAMIDDAAIVYGDRCTAVSQAYAAIWAEAALGFVHTVDKCHLWPRCQQQFLGFEIDWARQMVMLPCYSIVARTDPSMGSLMAVVPSGDTATWLHMWSVHKMHQMMHMQFHTNVERATWALRMDMLTESNRQGSDCSKHRMHGDTTLPSRAYITRCRTDPTTSQACAGHNEIDRCTPDVAKSDSALGLVRPCNAAAWSGISTCLTLNLTTAWHHHVAIAGDRLC